MHPNAHIVDLLKQNSPVSIVRIGDAEGIVLNQNSSKDAWYTSRQVVFYNHTGYYPTDQEMHEHRLHLIDAITHADILGLPKDGQKQGIYWTMIRRVIHDNVQRYPNEWCNIDIHLELLNLDLYRDIITQRPVLFYISCRNLDNEFTNRYGVQCNSFIIAPENRFTTYEGERHYPDQYNRIEAWMDSFNVAGQLLLIGSGVIGKQYGNWWRDRGGVAMDIGSVFDLWAGKLTRGEGKGKDVEDLKFKL